jgi:signal transduction histidine kinase
MDTTAAKTAEQDIYVFLLSRIQQPCFIVIDNTGTFLINKKFASTLKYRSIKEFYQRNETIYNVLNEDDLKISKSGSRKVALTKPITVRDRQMNALKLQMHLRYFHGFHNRQFVLAGILEDKEYYDFDQTLLSFLNNDEFLDEAMFILDFKGNMLIANRKIHHIDFFANLTDKNINFFRLIDESDREKLKKRIKGINKGMVLPPVEYKLNSPDNKTAYIKLYSRLIIYKKKKALLALIRDVTLSKQTEKRLIQTIIETEENERQRFAYDLHDELGPFLAGMKLHLNEIISVRNEPAKVSALLNYLLKMTDEASERIRTVSSNLTPKNMIDFGLVNSVEKMISQINKLGKIQVSLRIKGEEGYLENPFILSAYYIILELINNGIKHSAGSRITIAICFLQKSVHLIYTDNGKGFELEKKLSLNKGIGLRSILNRIVFFQGSYKFKQLEKGVHFEMYFPLFSL